MILALLTHVIVSVFVAATLSWANGNLTAAISIISLLLGFFAGAYIFKKLKREKDFEIDSFFTGFILFFIALFTLRHFAYLFYQSGAQLKTLNANNFGDLPLHIGIIRDLSAGNSFWPQFTSLAGTRLEYPFGMDLYNSLWQILGVSMQTHLFFVGVILVYATAVAVYKWAGTLGLIALFFNGSWAGYQYLHTGISADYQADLMWKNIFIAVIVTQRGFLIGFPVGLYLLKTVYDICNKDLILSKAEKILFGFFWGMLPLFHTYAFFIISIIMGLLVPRAKKTKDFLIPLLIAIPVALVWILPLTNFFKKVSFIWFQKGWGIPEGQPALIYLWNNYGPWLLLFAWCFYEVWMGRFKKYRYIFSIGLFLFVTFNFVMMAPWQWDNIKILIWPYLLMTFVASQIINESLKEYNKTMVYVVLGFSGFISVLALSNAQNKGHDLYSVSELNAIESVMKAVPKQSVFAAFPTFNHQLSFYGKRMVLGYNGHIWSHGLNDEGRAEKLNQLMMGAKNWRDLAKELNVSYIFWGPFEQKEYKVDNQPWRSLKNVSNSQEVQIYEVD